jgi:hypothetical protein
MAKIGIVCDDYKMEMFTDELHKAHLKFEVKKFTKTTVMFTIYSEQSTVEPIVKKVHQFYMDKYKKQN